MYAILGRGFGLYGYLPALTQGLGECVLLPRQYLSVVQSRDELACVHDKIIWAQDADDAIARATGAIVAVPPSAQPSLVERCLAHPGMERLVLEKPLAATPEAAESLLTRLRSSKVDFRVGFNFFHTQWYRALHWPSAAQSDGVTLLWTFVAHHFATGRDTWKRRHSEGGGALRFYGIHIIAMLAAHGYTRVRESRTLGTHDQPECWSAVFEGENLPECNVHVGTRDDVQQFVIRSQESGALRTILQLADPFGREHVATGDRRVPVLSALLNSFSAPSDSFIANYQAIGRLWQKADAAAETIELRGVA